MNTPCEFSEHLIIRSQIIGRLSLIYAIYDPGILDLWPHDPQTLIVSFSPSHELTLPIWWKRVHPFSCYTMLTPVTYDLWPMTSKLNHSFSISLWTKSVSLVKIRSFVLGLSDTHTKKQTNRQLHKQVNQTNQTKYIIFLAEVIIVCWIIRIKVSSSTVLSKFSKWRSTSY